MTIDRIVVKEIISKPLKIFKSADIQDRQSKNNDYFNSKKNNVYKILKTQGSSKMSDKNNLDIEI